MRFVYLAMIVLLTLVVVGFMVQNKGMVTVAWLSTTMTLPLSVLALLVYVLGMLTGGALLSAVRTWVRGATKPVPPAPAKTDSNRP
jgi:uncharacterized integral membrane protein